MSRWERCLSVWVVLVATALFGGCAARPVLHADLTDHELRELVDLHVPLGTPVDVVRARLAALGVDEGRQVGYEATAARPAVWLARLTPIRGFWNEPWDPEFRFIDLSFVLDDQRRTVDVLMLRDSVRYYDGDPVYGPSRPAMRRIYPYPATVPPPADPLDQARRLF